MMIKSDVSSKQSGTRDIACTYFIGSHSQANSIIPFMRFLEMLFSHLQGIPVEFVDK